MIQTDIHIQGYIHQLTGHDGHHCLLRAMCEASATPLHADGLLGESEVGCRFGLHSIILKGQAGLYQRYTPSLE